MRRAPQWHRSVGASGDLPSNVACRGDDGVLSSPIHPARYSVKCHLSFKRQFAGGAAVMFMSCLFFHVIYANGFPYCTARRRGAAGTRTRRTHTPHHTTPHHTTPHGTALPTAPHHGPVHRTSLVRGSQPTTSDSSWRHVARHTKLQHLRGRARTLTVKPDERYDTTASSTTNVRNAHVW